VESTEDRTVLVLQFPAVINAFRSYTICLIEVCNVDIRILQSLDFTVNRFFMKLFRTSNIEIVFYCQTVFGCELSTKHSLTIVYYFYIRCPEQLHEESVHQRYEKFIKKLTCTSV